MTHQPETHEEEIFEVTDAEEAVFEALLPAYMAGKLDIEKVRQVNQAVARLLESVKTGLKQALNGETVPLESLWS
jgi:hypothetical protein